MEPVSEPRLVSLVCDRSLTTDAKPFVTHINDVLSSVLRLNRLNCQYVETAEQLAAFVRPQSVSVFTRRNREIKDVSSTINALQNGTKLEGITHGVLTQPRGN